MCRQRAEATLSPVFLLSQWHSLRPGAMAGSYHSFALPSPEAPHGSSVTDGFVSRMCWGGTLPASRTRGEYFYCGQQPTSQPGQEENYPGVFLNLFHPIGGQMWPQCPEQLDSCRKILRTSATMCNVGSWVWVGPVTAPINLAT